MQVLGQIFEALGLGEVGQIGVHAVQGGHGERALVLHEDVDRQHLVLLHHGSRGLDRLLHDLGQILEALGLHQAVVLVGTLEREDVEVHASLVGLVEDVDSFGVRHCELLFSCLFLTPCKQIAIERSGFSLETAILIPEKAALIEFRLLSAI